MIATSSKALDQFVEVGLHHRAPRVDELVPDALERLARRARGEEPPVPLPWPSLGKALGGGLWPGSYVLTGGTGTGKSQLALQVALHAATQGAPALYVALELDKTEIVARLLGLLTGRRWSDLALGRDPTALEGIDDAVAALRGIPLHIEEAPARGWTADSLVKRGRMFREAYPEAEPGTRPGLVVVDYLQLVGSSPNVRQDLRERIADAAYAGRQLARDHNLAVLLLSSVARDKYSLVTGAKGPKPGEGHPGRLVGLGKESGDIEFASDGVLVLCQDNEDRHPGASPRVHLALAKLRQGRPCWLELEFDGNRLSEPATSPASAASPGGGTSGDTTSPNPYQSLA